MACLTHPAWSRHRHSWRRSVVVAVVSLVVLLGIHGPMAAQRSPDPLGGVQLAYEGAFRVPRTESDIETFAYGGTALTFDQTRQSLWLVGHDHHQFVAEISIPDIRTGQTIEDLATAELLTPFRDILQGRRRLVGENTSKIGGLLRDGSDWIVTAWLYYDGGGVQTLSHFRVGRTGQVSGPFQLGTETGQAGFVAGYMTSVPAEWRNRLGGPALTGLCCVSVISRSSHGPAVSAFDPRDVGSRSPVPIRPLLAYPEAHATLGEWSSNSPLFNGATQVGGLVFPAGLGRVIFFGRIGLGSFCYGTGTSVRALHGRPLPDGSTIYCYDPDAPWQGVHGYPYALHAWVYDASDLAAVGAGQQAPWDPRPLTAGTFSLPFERGQKLVGGVAYDAATQRVFVSVLAQDDEWPLIHVLRVTDAPPVDPTPDPPTSPGSSRRGNSPAVGRAVPR